MESIKEKLAYLNIMLEKYRVLNERTNRAYDWREEAIMERIEVLEDILNGVTNEFDECYEEDLEESELDI